MTPHGDSTLSSLLNALGLVILERRRDGTCVSLTPAPEWFRRLFPQWNEPLSEVVLSARFPFLDAFLAAAEKCAKAGHPFGMPLSTWSDSVNWVGAVFAAYGANLALTDVGTVRLMWTSKVTAPASQDVAAQRR